MQMHLDNTGKVHQKLDYAKARMSVMVTGKGVKACIMGKVCIRTGFTQRGSKSGIGCYPNLRRFE